MSEASIAARRHRAKHILLRALSASLFLLLLLTPTLHAQSALSDTEVEKLRDTAYYPPQRVEAFQGFLDDRIKELQRLTTGPRRPGREQDLHDQMEQFSSILNDLEDNLDDYSRRHKDVRKALPKLLSAAERWGSALRTPPDNPAYDVSRKLALEALDDLRQQTTALIAEQKDYFRLHPPGKEPAGGPPQ